MKSPTNNIQMYDMCCTYEILLSIKIKGEALKYSSLVLNHQT